MDEIPHIDPSEWPQENTPLTDEEALIVAMLILDGKPKSYVEGAKRLAQYVVDLNLQIEERSESIAEFVKREHDTVPSPIPEGTFTEEQKEQVMFDTRKILPILTAVDD